MEWMANLSVNLLIPTCLHSVRVLMAPDRSLPQSKLVMGFFGGVALQRGLKGVVVISCMDTFENQAYPGGILQIGFAGFNFGLTSRVNAGTTGHSDRGSATSAWPGVRSYASDDVMPSLAKEPQRNRHRSYRNIQRKLL